MISTRPDRVLSAASIGLLVLMLPLAFLASAAAGASLVPSPDSTRTWLAVSSAVPLLVAAAGLTTVMSLRRAAGVARSTDPARGRLSVLLGAGLAAAPLVQAATGRQFSWTLSILGGVGIVLVLLPAAAYRAGCALYVATVVAALLVGTGVIRDRPQGDPYGPAPVTSPGGPGASLPPAAPPR